MDVLWFRLAHREREQHAALGRFAAGQALVMLDRGDYWQCALIIRKGTAAAVLAEGLDGVPRAHRRGSPGATSVDEIQSLDDVKLLTVAVDRLTEWCRPGLLFIGDAAHAMSPIGGVGINLAIQDAVATANILAEPLRRRAVTLADLQRVQTRRMFPTRATQALQVFDPEPRDRPDAAQRHDPRKSPPWCGSPSAGRCCSAFRRGSSAWGFGRSMCGRRDP